MKRTAAVLWLALLAAVLPGQHAEAPAGESAAPGHAGGHGDSSSLWKWANFALLAGGLGYLIYRKAPPLFASRDRAIRQGIEEAAALRAQAEARALEIERRLANLSTEIEQLRAAAREEMKAEAARMRRETEQALGKIEQHAAQEIDSAAKAARLELKAHSASLALRLAEQRLRDGLTPPADEALVRWFVEDLGRPARPAGGEAH